MATIQDTILFQLDQVLKEKEQHYIDVYHKSKRSLLHFVKAFDVRVPHAIQILENGEIRCVWEKKERSVALHFLAAPYNPLNFALMNIDISNIHTHYGKASALEVVAIINNLQYSDVIKG